MKIRLDRFKALLARLQWPLAWKGFLKPAPVLASRQPAAGALETWQLQANAAAGAPSRILLPSHPEGGRHVLTGASAAYSRQAEGLLSVLGVGDFCGRKVKGERSMNWAEKPPRGQYGQPVEVVLSGVAGARSALSVCGYTEWEVNDAQD